MVCLGLVFVVIFQPWATEGLGMEELPSGPIHLEGDEWKGKAEPQRVEKSAGDRNKEKNARRNCEGEKLLQRIHILCFHSLSLLL